MKILCIFVKIHSLAVCVRVWIRIRVRTGLGLQTRDRVPEFKILDYGLQTRVQFDIPTLRTERNGPDNNHNQFLIFIITLKLFNDLPVQMRQEKRFIKFQELVIDYAKFNN